jgi:CRP-like cAMP-binding protein
VLIIHKKSKTKLAELKEDDFFGELSFFTGQVRTASARVRGFAELFSLDKQDFNQLIEMDNNRESKSLYDSIKSELIDK